MDIHRFEDNLARLERSPLPPRHPTVIDRNTFTETEEEGAQRFNFDENQKKQADQSRRHMAASQTEAETAMIPSTELRPIHAGWFRRRDAHQRAANAMKAASISSVEHHHRLTEVAEAAAVAAPFRFTSGGRRRRNKNRRTKNRRTKNRRTKNRRTKNSRKRKKSMK